MRVLIIASAITFLTLPAFGIGKDKSREKKNAHQSTIVITEEPHDTFYLKVNKVMLGGKAEIYSPEGELLEVKELTQRRLTIDFFNMQSGDYTIKLVKDEIEGAFNFHKDDSDQRIVVRASTAPGI